MSDLSLAYQGSAKAWKDGPASLYDRLAERIVAPFAAELAGALVLDVGAGTGALCRVLRVCGATPVALDSSADMLAHCGDAALMCVTGDMRALPFIDDTFGAAFSAFAISHVNDPERALAEMGRVVRGSGCVVAGVFGAAPPNPSKDVVDDIAGRFGYRPPPWYTEFKTGREPLTNTPELLRACAESAGLREVHVDDVVVEPGLTTPAEIVRYRLGMAHLAPFARALSAERHDRLFRQAVSAVRGRGQAVRPRVLILSSRAAA